MHPTGSGLAGGEPERPSSLPRPSTAHTNHLADAGVAAPPPTVEPIGDGPRREPGEAAKISRPWWHHLIVWPVVLMMGAGLISATSPWSGEAPGYSLDGFNGAVWGIGAESAAADPIGSRLGGARYDGDKYANHPPLTVWSAAVGHRLGNGDPLAVRLPAIIASLAALGLLAVVLLEAGLRPETTAIGVAVAGSTGMFLSYGAMLDTPVVSLPFGLIALIAAQRGWQGRPPAMPWLVLSGALAALSGWQAALCVVIAAATVTVLALLSSSRQRRLATRTSLGLLVGVVVGSSVTVAWILWVHGSLSPLFDQAQNRMSRVETSASWSELVVDHQLDLFGPGWLLGLCLMATAVGLVFGTRHRGDRPPEATWQARGARPLLVNLALTVVGYSLIFRNGAAVHDYWTYWGTALVGVAAATSAELLVRKVRSRHRRSGAAVGLVLVLLTASMAWVGHQRETAAAAHIRSGLEVEQFLQLVPPAAQPNEVAVAVYGSSSDVPWATASVDGKAVAVKDADGLRGLPPDLPVLVVLRGPPSPALQARSIRFSNRFALVPAAALADHLDR